MRQAGRYLPEYRQLRAQHDLLTICRTPELAAQVATFPVTRFGFDAAILFADIMLPAEPMGIQYTLAEGVGPVIANPLRTRVDIEQLKPVTPETDLAFVADAIRATNDALDGRVPLIGFAAAPFTLASYLVEGRPTRVFSRTKALMFSDPAAWHALMRHLTHMTTAYLRLQIDAGVHAVHLFDSWVGCLGVSDYRDAVLPYTCAIFAGLADRGVPRIHFGVGTAALLDAMADAGGEVIGVDWRLPLDEAWQRIGDQFAIQGNLDPARLLGAPSSLEAAVVDILRRAAGRPGHIFSLGHGVLPETPGEHIEWLAEAVHTRTHHAQPEEDPVQ